MDWAGAKAYAARLIDGCGYNGWVYERAKQAMPHYMWTVGDRRHREGWCSACERWVDLSPDNLMPDYAICDYGSDRVWEQEFEPFRPAGMTQEGYMRQLRNTTDHLATGECPHCHAAIQYRSVRKGHGRLMDRVFLVVYGKSSLEDDALVCVGLECTMDWRCIDEYAPSLPFDAELREVCVFRYGAGADRFVRVWRYDKDRQAEVLRWERKRECKSGFFSGRPMYAIGAGNVGVVLDRASYDEAVAYTRFGDVLSHDVDGTDAAGWLDRITLMAQIAKYPCIEYLYKLGYSKLARAVIDRQTAGLINLRGKTAQKVLKLSPADWAEVKGKRIRLDLGVLRVLKTARDAKLRVSAELCAWYAPEVGTETAIKTLLSEYREADAVKVLKYCRKHGIRHLHDYIDHLDMMRKLGIDAHDREFAYPRDFWVVHERLSERTGMLVKTDSDAAIRRRLLRGELDEYCFGALGLTMRPMLNGSEITAEGARLRHCVGGYVETYAKGNDVLCVLREDTAPDVPLYTVEFGKDGKLVQCRGYRNDTTPEGRERRRRDEDRLAQFWRLYELMREDFRLQRAREEKAKRAKEAKIA